MAIIGSGPSGFYAAEHLQEQDGLEVQIDMYDRLPTPFGLVRGGVAPDHQKIKSVTRVYDKIAAHPEFRFFGNVEMGRDITHEDLSAYYHAIIYAVGARTDRRMGIPREHLPGSHSATEFVGWYNAHPDYRSLGFDLTAASAAVVGQRQRGDGRRPHPRQPARGARRRPTSPTTPCAALAGNGIREIHVLGRRGPAQAAFTNKELKELGELPDVDVVVDPAEASPSTRCRRPTSSARPNRTRDRNLELLREYAARPLTGASTRIVLHFLVSPVEIIGTERVEALTIVHNELYESEDGTHPAPPDRAPRPPSRCGLVFRAIGYQGVPLPGIPFDAMRGIIPNEAGRIIEPPRGRAGPRRVRGRLDQARPPGDHRHQQARLPGDGRQPARRPGRRAPPQGGGALARGPRAPARRAPARLRLLRGLAADRPARAGARRRQRRAAAEVQPGRGDAARAPGAQAGGRRGGRPARV